MCTSYYKMIERASKKTQQAAWKSLAPIERKVLSSIVEVYGAYAPLGDVAQHGADTGWAGLTYCCEMRAFVQKNRAKVVTYWAECLQESQDSTGEAILVLSCWKGYTIAEIVTDIATGTFEFTADGLCWLIAENGAHKFVDYIDTREVMK